MSAVVAGRPHGVMRFQVFRKLYRSVLSVSVAPGAIAFTLILYGESSTTRFLPAFQGQPFCNSVCSQVLCAWCPTTELMNNTLPPFAVLSFQWLQIVQGKLPARFNCITLLEMLVYNQKSANSVMPALAITIFSLPKRDTAVSTICWIKTTF